MSRFLRSASAGFLAWSSDRARGGATWVAVAYLRRCATVVAVLGLLPCAAAMGGWLPGPFVTGSGHYTLIPGGDFESGTAEWILLGDYYGTWMISPEKAWSPTHAAKATAKRTSPNVGFAWLNQSVPVTGGQTYVLSGFFYRLQGQAYWLFMDDWDGTSFSVFVKSRATFADQWQFCWEEVTFPAGVSSITIRICLDTMDAGDTGYIDDVALTPVTEFVPPRSLLAGPTILMREPWVAADDVHSGPSGVDSLRVLWSDAMTFTENDISISNESGGAVGFTVSGSGSALMAIAFSTPLLNNKYTITIHDSVASAAGGVPIDGDNDGHTGGDAVLVMEHRNPFDHDHDNDVDQSDFGIFQRCFSGPGVAADPDCAD